MLELHQIGVYRDIKEKKLTAANSLFVEGVAFYIVKQNENGKAVSCYVCYLYPSGLKIGVDTDKVILIQRLTDRVDEVKKFMSDHGIKGI